MNVFRAICVVTAVALGAGEASGTGSKQLVAEGENPDLAITRDGMLHIVYTRRNEAHYRRRAPQHEFEREITLGRGADPAIGLGADGEPHVVLVSMINGGGSTGQSTLSYTRRDGASFRPLSLLVPSGGCYKPRVQVDGRGVAIITFEDRRVAAGRPRFIAIGPNGKPGDVTIVGEGNTGGLAMDALGTAHLTGRLRSGKDINRLYHTAIVDGRVSAPVIISPPASDFSDIAAHWDGSIRVVGEVAHACGIYYIERNRDGRWLPAQAFNFPEATMEIKDADDVNPAIAIDPHGRCFVTFTGAHHLPFYFVIDARGQPGPVRRIDPEGGPTGGKYQNPRVVARPDGGAWVAWGTEGKVYVTTLR